MGRAASSSPPAPAWMACQDLLHGRMLPSGRRAGPNATSRRPRERRGHDRPMAVFLALAHRAQLRRRRLLRRARGPPRLAADASRPPPTRSGWSVWSWWRRSSARSRASVRPRVGAGRRDLRLHRRRPALPRRWPAADGRRVAGVRGDRRRRPVIGGLVAGERPGPAGHRRHRGRAGGRSCLVSQSGPMGRPDRSIAPGRGRLRLGLRRLLPPHLGRPRGVRALAAGRRPAHVRGARRRPRAPHRHLPVLMPRHVLGLAVAAGVLDVTANIPSSSPPSRGCSRSWP